MSDMGHFAHIPLDRLRTVSAPDFGWSHAAAHALLHGWTMLLRSHTDLPRATSLSRAPERLIPGLGLVTNGSGSFPTPRCA